MRNLILAVLVLSIPIAARASGEEGIWKLNVAKSTFPDDTPAPKWRVLKMQNVDGGLSTVVDGEDARGRPFHAEYFLKYDGMKYPLKGNPTADTITAKQIDARTFVRTNEKDGKLIVTIRSVISEDGRTRTVYWEGKDKNGEPKRWVEVFDRQ